MLNHRGNTLLATAFISAAGLAGCATSYPLPPAASAMPVAGHTVDGPAGEDPRASDARNSASAYGLRVAEQAEKDSGWSAPKLAALAQRRDAWSQRLDAAPERLAATPTDDSASTLVDGLENLSQLTFAQEGADFDPRLSADGKWLVFASTQHRDTPDLYIKPVGSRTVTQLTADPASDIMPAISPDGSKIAFASNRNGTWNLYLMSAAGGQAVQLSTQNVPELHPSWSPDGQRLIFSRLGQTTGRWELWVMEVSKPQVAEFVGFGLFPEWCPAPGTGADKHDRILFQRGRERGDRAFSLWTIDYQPGNVGNPTEIVSARDRATINAAWSPDGQFVVYSTVAVNQQNTNPPADLWIAAVDGSSQIRLTAGNAQNLMPAWSADNRIYFVSSRGGADHIWSITADKALAAAGAASKLSTGVATAPSGE